MVNYFHQDIHLKLLIRGVLIIKWINGEEIAIKQFSGEEICEKLALELFNYDYSEWLAWEEFLQVACFIIDFDTELAMNGIFSFLENTIRRYASHIITAFQAIGADKEAKLLSEICNLASVGLTKGEFLNENIISKIENLENQLYLYTGFDIWKLLYNYLDNQIKKL